MPLVVSFCSNFNDYEMTNVKYFAAETNELPSPQNMHKKYIVSIGLNGRQ